MYAQEYVSNEVEHLDNVELVCLLYAKAIEKIRQAKTNLTDGQIGSRGEAVGRAQAILVELESSLDHEVGGEISRNLARLYEYIQQRLILGHAEQNAAALTEAESLMTTLYEGWREARAVQAPAAMASEPAAAVPGADGRAWTL